MNPAYGWPASVPIDEDEVPKRAGRSEQPGRPPAGILVEAVEASSIESAPVPKKRRGKDRQHRQVDEPATKGDQEVDPLEALDALSSSSVRPQHRIG